jgi:biopolymer transport protein ExbD
MALRQHFLEEDIVESHEINVTPFIDVMLVLLIIFMVAAPLATVNVAVDLPSSTAKPHARPDKPIFLSLKLDQKLVLGDKPVTYAQLPGALDSATGDNKQERIFLQADKTVSYGELMKVMDALRAAGYLKVALVGLEARATP